MRRSSGALVYEGATRRRRVRRAIASQALIEVWALRSIRVSLLMIAILLNGDFHPALLPGGEGSAVQQYVGLLCWIVIAVASFFVTPKLDCEWTAGLYLNLAFYLLAIMSFLWSQNITASMPKCVALAVVIFGAWRITFTLDWDEIVALTHDGLFYTGVASIIVALAVPSIGVLTDWQHAGQWNGVYVSKQTLGVCGAVQLFLASYRLMNGARGAYYWVSVAVAIICVLTAGSRGGGALAATALLALYLMKLSRSFARAMAFAPFILGLLASALIADLLYTQNRYLVIFGVALDFTERTFIWQHALRFFWDAPWLGYGLNGFWSLGWVKDLFVVRYGWYLDNYHNGYINVLVETGFIGFILFLLSYLAFGFRMNAVVTFGYFPERQTSFGVAFTCLLFFIDFTEAFFARSTNFRSTMLLMILAFTFAKPAGPCANALPEPTQPTPRPLLRRARGGRA